MNKEPLEIFGEVSSVRVRTVDAPPPLDPSDTSRDAIESAYPLIIRHQPTLIVGGLMSEKEALNQLLAHEMGMTPAQLCAAKKGMSHQDALIKAMSVVRGYPLAMVDWSWVTVDRVLNAVLPPDGGTGWRRVFIDLNRRPARDGDPTDEFFYAQATELARRLRAVAGKEGVKVYVIQRGTVDTSVGPRARVFSRFDPSPVGEIIPYSDQDIGRISRWREFARRAFYRDAWRVSETSPGNPFLALCDTLDYSPEAIGHFRRLLDEEFGAWMTARGMRGHNPRADDTQCDCFDPEPVRLDMSWLQEVKIWSGKPA